MRAARTAALRPLLDLARSRNILLVGVVHPPKCNPHRVSGSHGQTDWEPRFNNLGARISINDNTRILAQVMTGQTIWGQLTPMGYWTDVDFSAGYVLLTHEFDGQALTGRVDLFQVTDRSFMEYDNNSEDGWAITGAYRIDVAPRLSVMVEGVHVSSQRPARADAGVDVEQGQSSLQTALRYSF